MGLGAVAAQDYDGVVRPGVWSVVVVRNVAVGEDALCQPFAQQPHVVEVMVEQDGDGSAAGPELGQLALSLAERRKLRDRMTRRPHHATGQARHEVVAHL
ncbi:hypothetical protein SAMN04489729_4522 [Amycolatopsis lurida]|uniref:Uncharacterized protein n=1 Tax=Amycolatopsis lurida NRRL 2430 TaxID=1460371 RepID=A0A2P2FG81_AMYLU|nr:hypothetical protein [Amycolatopsis lurida]KFU75737.1 hypothetical protein BB31_40025 [Amycolatopsis lurida NRRL 2430]SED50196.1 hypothetical protein SAMN04489729_4522 [Amycolatopsis lurida]